MIAAALVLVAGTTLAVLAGRAIARAERAEAELAERVAQHRAVDQEFAAIIAAIGEDPTNDHIRKLYEE